MIIVILGGSDSLSDEVISQLMQSKITRIRHLSIAGLVKCDALGLSRLKTEFDQPSKLTNLVTIVSGITTNNELNYLRSKDAMICHCYGELTDIYDYIECVSSDKYVLPEPLLLTAPDHIYSPSEVLSDCYIKG